MGNPNPGPPSSRCESRAVINSGTRPRGCRRVPLVLFRRNRRASDYPQEAQRVEQTFWAGPRHQSMCLFSNRCGPLNKRKDRSHGSGKMSTHSLLPGSDSDISSSSTPLTAAGIDKRRYNTLQRCKACPRRVQEACLAYASTFSGGSHATRH
jgi:hypothetical protein